MKNITEEKLTYSPMKGTPGHCFAAQIWDAEGFGLASIDSRYGARKATKYAKLFAASPIVLKALQNLLKEVDELIDHVIDQGFIDFEDESIEGVKNINEAKLIAIKAIKKAIG